MGKVTGNQVREAMMAANITQVDHHECGICGEMTFYSREGCNLFFNAGCGCAWSPPQPREWNDAAEFINMQDAEWQEKLKACFGLLPNTTDEPRPGVGSI
jgi:ribosomal protein L37AE/L43A